MNSDQNLTPDPTETFSTHPHVVGILAVGGVLELEINDTLWDTSDTFLHRSVRGAQDRLSSYLLGCAAEEAEADGAKGDLAEYLPAVGPWMFLSSQNSGNGPQLYSLAERYCVYLRACAVEA